MKQLVLAAAATICCSAYADQPGTVLAAPGGRFVFGQVSSYRSDQYMLDTQTGQLWQIQCTDTQPVPGTCVHEVLTPINYAWTLSPAGTYSLTPQLMSKPEAAAKK